MTAARRLLLAILVLGLLWAALQRAGDLGGQLVRNIEVRALDLPSETGYRLVEIIPAPAGLPAGFTENYGACYHFTYEGLGELGLSPDGLRRLILSSRARCGLLLISAGDAADAGRVSGWIRAAREAGLELIVLRILFRPRWKDVREAAERFSRMRWRDQDPNVLEDAARVYGDWARTWAGHTTGAGGLLWIFYPADAPANLAQELAMQGVYVQILNEPNVAEEYQDPDHSFRNGLFAGDLFELGRDVCAFHIPYIRMAFPPVVWQEGGQIRYDLSAVAPRLVIPDLAAASAAEKRRFIDGCLSVLSGAVGDFPGLNVPEYAITGVRGGVFVYGMHIYAPSCHDPLAAAEALRQGQLAAVWEHLAARAAAGAPFFSGVMVTEFGGAFHPGSGCDRNKQRDLYAAITALAPDIPFFWWIYASRQCRDGTYAANTPEEWDKSALVQIEPDARSIRACGAGP